MSEDTPRRAGAEPLPAPSVDDPRPAVERREALALVYREAKGCTRCPQLVGARTQVVFGAGDADADVLLVGEAPGVREDEQGALLVGAAGKVLDEVLAGVGLDRTRVFLTTVLKCRPPGNRDPAPAELARCRPYLLEQIALVEPRVVVTLGNFATKLLRDDAATGIRDLHGRDEVVTLGRRTVRLLPVFHPATVLYTRALRDTLEADLARLPELLARPALPQPELSTVPAFEPEPVDGGHTTGAEPAAAATSSVGDEPTGVAEPAHGATVRPRPERDGGDEGEGADEPQLGLF